METTSRAVHREPQLPPATATATLVPFSGAGCLRTEFWHVSDEGLGAFSVVAPVRGNIGAHHRWVVGGRSIVGGFDLGQMVLKDLRG